MTSAPGSLVQGTLLTVAMRWTDRLIGLVSTLILARLLTPADFGIIAMATLVIALADVLLDLGTNIALVRDPNATREHYDTAWTLRLIQTALSTALIIAAAPLAADYFGDARVQPVLQILAFSLLLGGLENIGIVAFHKQMQFGDEFRVLFARRIAGFVITIVAAIVLRNYWALVIGTLGGRLLGVVLSYLMHPMRPRLSLARFRALFAVSQWMLLRGIGDFLNQGLHRMLVGRWNSAPVMGAYTVAHEIATMPSAELVAPMNRALFPALAAAHEDPAERQRLFLLALGLQAAIAIPAATGLALVAPLAVPVLLGAQWSQATPLLQLLALAGIAHALTAGSQYLLIVLGKLAQATTIIWLQVGLFAALALLAMPGADAEALAALRLGVSASAIFATAAFIRRHGGIALGAMARACLRPLAATSLMALAVFASSGIDATASLPPAIMLIVQIALGSASYAAALFGLWALQGRPAGAESWLVTKIRSVTGR